MDKTEIQTSAELFSTVLITVREAARYFAHCSGEMREHRNEACASIFEQISTTEREREKQIVSWAESEGLRLSHDATPLDWQDPNVRNEYDVAALDPIRSTPYRVLALVAHNADRAFRFFAHVAAYAEDDSMSEYAEILAQEELQRAAQFRSLRRRAWHAERDRHRNRPKIEPGTVASTADLFNISASLERCVLTSVKSLLETYPALSGVVSYSEAVLKGVEPQARSSEASRTQAAIRDVDSIEVYCKDLSQNDADDAALLQRLYSDCDCCFMYYDALVTRTMNEAVMLQAQQLAASAMARIDMLRDAVVSAE
jgi:hypothetical protein